MNLYLLSQEENNDYDTYDSCVVCAKSKADAIKIGPDGKPLEEELSGSWNVWALTKEGVKCELIGKANSKQKRGVILASFNAG